MGISTLAKQIDSDSEPASPPDSQLLERFVATGDQEAFARLVERLGPYVLGVCRRLMGHTQDAEDVFQVCFLELARNASSIRRARSVAGWLQSVAVRVARRARGRRFDRWQREMSGATREAILDREDITWRETQQILEQELGLLPEELRSAMIACYFEGMTLEQAGQVLEVEPRTLKARVARGRELLRKRLSRRGVTLTVLGGLLASGNVHATVSTSLQEVTVRAAAAVLRKSTLTGILSPSVLSLTGSSPGISGWGIVTAGILAVALGTGTALVFRPEAIGIGGRPARGPAGDNRRSARELSQPAPLLASWADEAQSPRKDEPEDSVVKAARGYKLFLGPERRPVEMQSQPVLRWPNVVRGTADGATFIWVLDGRPEAIACIWRHGVLSNAFQSLSSDKLVAEYGGQTIWHPEQPGISFNEFPKAPLPADSAVKRLVQMKELARRFSCRLVDQKEELRLMPRPLYRYKTDRPELFDGALFTFAQGTDPEVILVLEAQRKDKEPQWKYALTRRSMLPLEAQLDGDSVWSVPQSIGAPDQPWFHGVVTE